jgi:glycosyltransferase involved in cell wall biosynthesis
MRQMEVIMRIAMLTNNYKPYVGGVPISIERLAGGLRSLGHEVYIFAPSYEGEAEEPFVIRYHSRKKKLRGEYVVPDIFDPKIEEVFTTISFDLIHVHHPMLMGYTAQYLSKKYHLPIVFTYHTRYEQYLHYILPVEKWNSAGRKERNSTFRSLEKKLLFNGGGKLVTIHNRIFTNQCDLVFAPTPSIKEYLLEHGTNTAVEVIPTGLSGKEFEFNKSRVKEIRRKFLGPKKCLFCTVSRLEKEKNIDFLLEGLKELKENWGDCFRLLILGEGTQKEELIARTAELGLKDNVTFCGLIPHEELTNYYHASDLFLFASQSETQGIVLLEAMAAGLPVIAIKASGVTDVVKDGKNGYMTEKDSKEWEKKLELVITKKHLYEQMKQEAIKVAKQYLAVQVARNVEKYYQSVLITDNVQNKRKTFFHQRLVKEYEDKTF